jgi:hypothetical protein
MLCGEDLSTYNSDLASLDLTILALDRLLMTIRFNLLLLMMDAYMHGRMMSAPAYDLMFGKLSLRALFDDYFHHGQQAGLTFSPPLYDARVDLTATVSSLAEFSFFSFYMHV